MSRSPYNYSDRNGVVPISWDVFHGICKALAARRRVGAMGAEEVRIRLAKG